MSPEINIEITGDATEVEPDRVDISVFTKAICGKLGVTYENVRRLEIHPREAFVEVDVFPDVPKRIDEKGDLMSEVLKFEVST